MLCHWAFGPTAKLQFPDGVLSYNSDFKIKKDARHSSINVIQLTPSKYK